MTGGLSAQRPVVKNLGILGWDEEVRLLLEHLSEDHRYPRKNLELLAWSPLSEHPGVKGFESIARQSPRAVLEQKGVDLLYLATNAANDTSIMNAVAASGLETIGFLPFASAESSGNPQPLHVSSHLRASLTGLQGLELVAAGEIGTVVALYIGYRTPRQPAEDTATALRRSLWEALDYALAVVDSPLKRLFYRASALMGEARDHVQLMLRFDNDCIASLDVLLLADGIEPVLDIEITGREGLLQLRPNHHQVRYTSRGADGEGARLKLLDWHMPPVIQLLDAFATAQPAPSQLTTSLNSNFVRLMERLEQNLQEAGEGIITF